MEKVLARKYGDVDKGLQHLAEKLVTLAENPNDTLGVCRDVADRFDGKPAQAITGADGGPLTVQVVKFADDSDTR